MAAKKAKKPSVAKKQEIPGKGTNMGRILFPALACVLFFLALCLCADANLKIVSLLLCLGALAMGVWRFGALRSRLHLPLLLLLLLVVMGGVSSLYAQSGKLALQEFLKLLAGFAAALWLLLACAGDKKSPAAKMAQVLELAAAIAAFISVDLLSTRLFSGAVLGLLGSLDSHYAGLAGVEAGVRLTSIFDNPNIFAGCAGIGVLLSLGLSMGEGSRGEKRLHLSCLYICSVAFVLAFSMGAVASIVLGFAVYLLLEQSGKRAQLLLLMVKTLILCVLSVALISLTSLDAWDGFQPIPLVCLVLGSVLLCLAEEKLGGLTAALEGRSRAVGIGAGALVILLLGFVLAAYNFTGGAKLAAGESLSRSVYPKAGEYTVSAVGGREVQLGIYSQNRAETMMHTRSLLYSGSLEEAAFTVPEDSIVVYFELRAGADTTLESLEYSGPEGSGSVPLDYKLLPDFIANRLQGLFANQNAIQRTVFFRDGMKLFAVSPVFGLGMGAFESGVQSVQSFHYETKYVHNHYIQLLLETGILGLAIFLALLAVCAWAIIRSRRGQQVHPLTPALGAALVFMAVHGGVEVVFSSYCYLPLACGVFLLINECCGAQADIKALGPKARGGILIGFGAAVVVYSALVVGGMMARNIAEKGSDYASLERAAAMDAFEWPDYALTYIIEAANDPGAGPNVRAQAEKYAQRLDRGISNTRYYYLADYYFALDNVEKGMEMLEKHARCVTANSGEWDNIFYLLRMHNLSGELFLMELEALVEMMESWNGENMGQIVLNEGSRTYIDRALNR